MGMREFGWFLFVLDAFDNTRCQEDDYVLQT